MPILAAEPNVFPENLLQGFTTEPVCMERNWWAVYTKPRQEKSLTRQLISQSVPVYLPLVEKKSLVNGRRIKSQMPVFSSYLFVYGNSQERLKALETNRIVQMISAPHTEEMTEDLQRIQMLISSGAAITIESQISKGDRVRIKHGSLMGLEGVVVTRRNESRLLISVKFLQQGVSVLLEDFQVEKL